MLDNEARRGNGNGPAAVWDDEIRKKFYAIIQDIRDEKAPRIAG